MEIQTDRVEFGALKGSGPQDEVVSVQMAGPITQAIAVLTGIEVGFSKDDGDHELGNLDVRLRTEVDPPDEVRVRVIYGLRDWSGDWDDDYEGRISFAVIAE
jgi:hypothetical protein